MTLKKQKIILEGYSTKQWINNFETFIHQYLSWYSINTKNLNILNLTQIQNNIEEFNNQHLYFELGKYSLTPKSSALLDKQTAKIIQITNQLNKIGKNYKLEIIGYADQIGNSNFNRDISYKRAEHIASFFTEIGIAKEKIKITGNGTMKNTNKLNISEMRRVDFNLVTE